jgi:hypothetical protein
MKITFKKLAEYMEKHQTHVYVAWRTTDYIIPHSIEEGQHIMMTKKGSDDVAGDVKMDEDGIMGLGLDSLEEDDVMVEIDEVEKDIEESGELEVEDDGNLDIF